MLQRYGFALVPLLAVVAYATVLRIGFLGDDYILAEQAHARGLDPGILLPLPGRDFYRPTGQILTWTFGWYAWGFNPLPYHVEGLLLHAATSLVLALLASEITRRPLLGWLVGASFAVFPLHLEAIGWVAAQWDVEAAFFGILSAYLFTKWWRRRSERRIVAKEAPDARAEADIRARREHDTWRDWLLLAGAVVSYALGLFAKESLLTFIPLVGLSAWAAVPPRGWRDWRVMLAGLVPVGGVLLLNLALRVWAWGRLGNYSDARTDYPNFVWDAYINWFRTLLSPINPAVFNSAVAQVVGVASMVLVIAGLALYGRSLLRLIALAGAWLLLTVLPVLNLPLRLDNLESNRFMYLPAAGYCLVIGGLLYSVLRRGRPGSRWQRKRAFPVAWAVTGCLFLASIAVCWIQLRPWHTASVLVEQIGDETLALIPPTIPRSTVMLWYVENLPDNYKGAYLYRIGMGAARLIKTRGDGADIRSVPHANEAPLAETARQQDVFSMRFRLDKQLTVYRVVDLSGITWENGGPGARGGDGAGATSPTGDLATGLQGSGSTSDALLWDFAGCNEDTLRQWTPVAAILNCQPGKGVTAQPHTDDPQLISPPLNVAVPESTTGFVRIRVAASYPKADEPDALVSQLYWSTSIETYAEAQSREMPAIQDGRVHIYWTYVPAEKLSGNIVRFRLDPINSTVPSTIKWIAVDTVP